MYKSGWPQSSAAGELALVVLLLGLRLSFGFNEKLRLLRFCGIAILSAPPEKLPGGRTPWSACGTGGYKPYYVCLPHTTAKRCPSGRFSFCLRRLPLSKTEFNCTDLRPWSDPGKPVATHSLSLEMKNARQQNQQGSKETGFLGGERGVGGEH